MNFITRWFGRSRPDDQLAPAPLAPSMPVVDVPEQDIPSDDHFTLVRHSHYAVSADPAFEGVVEVREVTRNQAYVVRKAGGAIFSSQDTASEGAAAANRATAPGYFSSVRIGGAEVYIAPAVASTTARP